MENDTNNSETVNGADLWIILFIFFVILGKISKI